MGFEHRILSAAALREDPKAIYVIQSDASGEDGKGYLHGYLDQDSLSCGSHNWGAEGAPEYFHAMELHALHLCLWRGEYRRRMGCCYGRLIPRAWPSRSKKAAALALMETILGACD